MSLSLVHFSSRHSWHLHPHAQLLILIFQAGAMPTSEAISHLQTGGCAKGTGTVPFGVSAAGGFQLIYDPRIEEPQPWYENDDTFVKDALDGTGMYLVLRARIRPTHWTSTSSLMRRRQSCTVHGLRNHLHWKSTRPMVERHLWRHMS